jgi:four helix bundle protein
MKSYRELKVWSAAMDLAVIICRFARHFPKEEMYGLGAQLRRSAVSVPSNIAEGSARDTTKDFLRFLSIAKGSLAEMETQLELAVRLDYLKEDIQVKLRPRFDEIGKMLSGLQKALRRRLITNH